MKQDLENLKAFAPLVSSLLHRADKTQKTRAKLRDLETDKALALDTILTQDSIMLRCTKDMVTVILVSF
jgi:hypothetical protein